MTSKSFREIVRRLYVSSVLVTLALLCRSTLVMAGNSPFTGIVSTDQSVAQSTVITPAPPEGFAPLTASDGDLEYYGFPPRPDERNTPEAYANWKKMVSVPRGANPQATQTTIWAGPAKDMLIGPTLKSGNVSATTSNWSGYAITSAAGKWTHNDNYVFQEFFVPVAQPAFGVCNNVPVYKLQWPGFDGAFISGDVLQAGALEAAQCSSSGTSTVY
jgi:hypothetical protein